MPQTFLRVGTSCKNHGLRQRHFYCLADLVLFLKSLFSRPLFARAYPSSGNGLQHLFTNSVHCLFHFGGKLSKMRSAKWAKSPKRAKMGKAQLETSVLFRKWPRSQIQPWSLFQCHPECLASSCEVCTVVQIDILLYVIVSAHNMTYPWNIWTSIACVLYYKGAIEWKVERKQALRKTKQPLSIALT